MIHKYFQLKFTVDFIWSEGAPHSFIRLWAFRRVRMIPAPMTHKPDG